MGIVLSILKRFIIRREAPLVQTISTSDISHPYPLAAIFHPADPSTAHAPPRNHDQVHEFGMERPSSAILPESDRSGSQQMTSGPSASRGQARKLRKARMVEGDWNLLRQRDWGESGVEFGAMGVPNRLRELGRCRETDDGRGG